MGVCLCFPFSAICTTTIDLIIIRELSSLALSVCFFAETADQHRSHLLPTVLFIMAGPQRATSGLPTRRTTTRQPTRRAGSTAPERQNATNSPSVSTKAPAYTRSRALKSPTEPASVTAKRKERDIEREINEDTSIHVAVRCRGRNEREVKENSGVALSTEGAKGKTVELSMGPNAVSNKTYTFDKVFSAAADQVAVYEDVVLPIVTEVRLSYLRERHLGWH